MGGLVAMLRATDELALAPTIHDLTIGAVGIVRDRLGLERASLYLLELSPSGWVLRGTWGTGVHGQTTDERDCRHEVSLDALRH